MWLKKIRKNPFKKISLTLKITLWYTTFIVLLLGTIVAGTFFVGNKIIDNASKRDLVKEVSKIAEGHEDFSSFEDGVTLSLYDEKGNLIAGTVPKNFSVTELNAGNISEYTDNQDNKYAYYDIVTDSPYLGNAKYVRGVIQISEGKTNWLIPISITLISPIVIFIIMYGGYRIINSSLKPVRDMTKTAKDISSSSDLSKRLKLNEGEDEVHQLGKVFNEMLDTLERSAANEKRFSSDVSHELRTPVSVIKAESEYALKYADSVEEAKESFEVIERHSSRMTVMINQILEISRLDSDTKIEKQKVDLSKLVEKHLSDQFKIFEMKGIELSIDIKENINVLGNEALLMRVLDNLTSNALKYADTTVKVNLFEGDSVVLEVVDDGRGIEDSEKKNIWNRFYKIDKSRTVTEDNSSGLGLSIVKKIVEIHRGEIFIFDNKPSGAKFVVNFPKC